MLSGDAGVIYSLDINDFIKIVGGYKMRLGCFVMMRNESPILEAFLDQIEALFDLCVVLDHGSKDSSADMVRARKNCVLYNLKSNGYPQSEVATYFGNEILKKWNCDYVFFLDCDEFLAFDSRLALEAFLVKNNLYDVIRFPWLNVCPEKINGDNIFANNFYSIGKRSIYHKAVISKRIFEKVSDFVVMQGYHDVAVGDSGVKKYDVLDHSIIHIPIQSYVQFGFKLANGHNRLVAEQVNLKKRNGFHWVDLAKKYAEGELDEKSLKKIALTYPDWDSQYELELKELEFDFPYLKSGYAESQDYVRSQISGLIGLELHVNDEPISNAYAVYDSNGLIVCGGAGAEFHNRNRCSFVDLVGDFEESFLTMIEPLFNLPSKLPVTAWKGHIPFMFVLFKLMRPNKYVELGVHNGASLIAACTAAKTYNVECDIYGVDAWEGDIHAGIYDGNSVYNELKQYVDSNYVGVCLVRNYFNDARKKFGDESIDLLHIDGLHTYEAVKEDFMTWFSAMSPSGVIIFHDISVYDKGFGVYRLWREIKEKFVTIEFYHSYGLGVLFLDPNDSRIAPLVALASNQKSLRLYQSMLALIGDVLPERMTVFEPEVRTEVVYRGFDAIKPIRKIKKSIKKRMWRK